MLLPVELLSINTDSAPSAPLATAVVWNASAEPAGLKSTWLSVAVSPKRRMDGAETVRVTVTIAGEFWTPAAPVTVTWPVYVFGIRPVSETLICRLCGALPLVGDTESQLESLAAVNESVLLPVLVTETFDAAGLAPPWVPLKLSVNGETLRMGLGGGGGCTVKLTITVAGEPCEPADVTVMCPVARPWGRVLESAVTCKACGALPLLGETVSQAESDDVVKLRVPPPELATFIEPMVACPCGALSESVVGVTPSTGVEGTIPTR